MIYNIKKIFVCFLLSITTAYGMELGTVEKTELNKKLFLEIRGPRIPDTQAMISLLKAGASANLRESDSGYSIIHSTLLEYYRVKTNFSLLIGKRDAQSLYYKMLVFESAMGILLDNNADVSLQNKRRETPVYTAVRNYDKIRCKKLLKRFDSKTCKLILEKKNNRNETACDLANKLYNKEKNKRVSLLYDKNDRCEQLEEIIKLTDPKNY